jgi:hypothetical protein
MATWTARLFGNDTACDVRDEYRDLIEVGVDDGEATRRTIQKFSRWFDDAEDGPMCWLALAVTQSKLGRLEDAVCDRALQALDAGLETAFDKARGQLTGPQPTRKKLRPPKRHATDLVEGDVLVFEGARTKISYCVIGVRSSRPGDTVTLMPVGDFAPDPTMPVLLARGVRHQHRPQPLVDGRLHARGSPQRARTSVEPSGWGTYWAPLAERLRAIVD